MTIYLKVAFFDDDKPVDISEHFSQFSQFREFLENNSVFSDKDIRLLKLSYRFGMLHVLLNDTHKCIDVYIDKEED